MLLVQARAGISQINGIGLIAQEFIPAGTAIWRFMPGFDVAVTDEEFSRLSKASQIQVRHYSFRCRETGRFLLSSDDDRFTNHADEPNTSYSHGYTRALRDIKPGEELTGNYDEFGLPRPNKR